MPHGQHGFAVGNFQPIRTNNLFARGVNGDRQVVVNRAVKFLQSTNSTLALVKHFRVFCASMLIPCDKLTGGCGSIYFFCRNASTKLI